MHGAMAAVDGKCEPLRAILIAFLTRAGLGLSTRGRRSSRASATHSQRTGGDFRNTLRAALTILDVDLKKLPQKSMIWKK